MKLLLLSGKTRRTGWVTLDGDPQVRPDIVRMLPPLALPLGSCQEIELCHGIGHFYKWEAEALLKEMYVALSPHGILTLEQPNLQWAAEVLAGVREAPAGLAPGQADMWPIYGDPNHRNPLHSIKWGWTPQTLKEALLAAGFQKVELQRAQHHVPERDFRIQAHKL